VSATGGEAPRGEPVDLGDESGAFTRGGNRLCFVDPRDQGRCIKVLRADRLPEIKRRERGFPKNLKPLHAFDDNRQELRVYRRIHRALGEQAYDYIPRVYGLVDTNLGEGLCCDLVRDDDDRISLSLKQYLWLHGRDREIEQLVNWFCAEWCRLGMPSRNLLLHNMVVQSVGGRPQRLVVIDGLGWPDLLPLAWYWPAMARRKAARKTSALYQAIDALLEKRETQADYGYHGWLEEGQRAR
jgi:hypothetical protein